MRKIISVAILGLVVVSGASCVSKETRVAKTESASVSEGPVLEIKVGEQARSFSREQLLKSPAFSSRLKNIVVEKDPAYSGRKMTYRAIPAASLFAGLPVEKQGTMLFKCLDGFSAPISSERLLNTSSQGSIAYIAIEPAETSWPNLKNSQNTPGPFYLIWENPEKSKIATEEWPFQLAGFEQKPSIETMYPHTKPKATVAAKSPIRDGYKVFTQNCFACHTMNGEGSSQMGPDLNLPFNPTEYLKPDFLVKLIRDPKNLRQWSQSKMNGFDKDQISDRDMKNLIAYLRHMATLKK